MTKSFTNPPEMQIDPAKRYVAHFITNRGEFEVELFASRCPTTVNNFVFLARKGFYDGIIFHRVINNFMIQGGDPTGTGRGGPGYKWDDELSALKLRHETGTLSMANAGPNTNGSQFFITHSPQPHLNGKHAVFGQIMGNGQEVVNAIRQGDVMESVTIQES
ncbi:MAG: peptidylprolyl isomerase [Anaerolineae bacterium]|jgi:peptidyl-prolyl cis-trans isomerase B (cyclophilin B)|nr:peptidylprolyl isomerase [Anaerolineae bacterium]